MPQQRLELGVGHDPLPPLGVQQGHLVEGVLGRQQVALDRPVPAPLQGDDGVVDRLGLVGLRRLAVADPGAVGDAVAELLGLLAGDVPSLPVSVDPGELGQPALVVEVGVVRPLDLHRVEEQGDQFDDREAGERAATVALDFLLEVQECIPGGLEAVGLGAEAVTLAAEIGDVPSPAEVRLGRARHGCLLPNKKDSCW